MRVRYASRAPEGLHWSKSSQEKAHTAAAGLDRPSKDIEQKRVTAHNARRTFISSSTQLNSIGQIPPLRQSLIRISLKWKAHDLRVCAEWSYHFALVEKTFLYERFLFKCVSFKGYYH